MKKILNILLACCIISYASAQDNVFQQANQAYADGNYTTAIELYQLTIDSIGTSAQVYYNLGNAYFKTNELGRAILNYERALALDPFYKDAKYNLEIAQARIIDNVTDSQSFFLMQWVSNLINLLKAHTWMIISFICFFIMLVSLFIYFFSHRLVLRKTGFHLSWITFLICIITLSFTLISNDREQSHSDAIVMAGIVNAKASPDRSGTDLFVLHEGTKVHITEALSEWVEIEVGNNTGWVPIKAIERI